MEPHHHCPMEPKTLRQQALAARSIAPFACERAALMALPRSGQCCPVTSFPRESIDALISMGRLRLVTLTFTSSRGRVRSVQMIEVESFLALVNEAIETPDADEDVIIMEG